MVDAVRATGLTFDQLEAMDATDYGTLICSLREFPPLHRWLPLALAQVIFTWGGVKRIDKLLESWGFKTATGDLKDEDAAFLAALRG